MESKHKGRAGFLLLPCLREVIWQLFLQVASVIHMWYSPVMGKLEPAQLSSRNLLHCGMVIHIVLCQFSHSKQRIIGQKYSLVVWIVQSLYGSLFHLVTNVMQVVLWVVILIDIFGLRRNIWIWCNGWPSFCVGCGSLWFWWAFWWSNIFGTCWN